jgi:hypothetical protein
MKHKEWCTALLTICLMGLVNCTTGDRLPPVGSTVEAITVTSGTQQSHAIDGAFVAPLAATVTKSGSLASGVAVTFTAPTTGASGKFADTGTNTTKATSDANGVATAAAFTANGTAGAYTVTATASGAQAGASFNLSNTTGAPGAITAVSGTPQSSGIGTTFGALLLAKVVDSGQNPVGGAIVTFRAPATGASGTFADTGTGTTAATTNAAGVATASAFTANGMSGADMVMATVGGVPVPATFNLTNSAGAIASIMATSGTPQSTLINTAFPAPLVATVLDTSLNPVSGVSVTFSAPITSASGTFSNGTTTETDTTDATGKAASSVFSANGTAGAYTVTATVAGVATPANFSLTNSSTVVTSKTYVFYLSGEENPNTFSYGLAGAVQIDSTGNVLGGEQDYNDGEGNISSDTINGGSLSVNGTTGQGTLTLITNNTNRGVQGSETVGVQFVNLNHALIVQFDGTATSSGSLDLQTLPTALSGGYAFTLAGLDPSQLPVALGGVFTISGTSLNGSFDTNDNGTVTQNVPLSGTLTTVDSFGRGTITTNSIYSSSVTLNYYVVGPEVLRIIDVDTSTFDSAIGSAFGQGVNATSATNASLGSSVFGIAGDSPSTSVEFAAAGMFSTNASAATFSGFADDDELYNQVQASSLITGVYTIGSNGYGNLTITSGTLGDINTLGVYLTDPSLNLIDPNNTTGGSGGGLVADMDPNSTLSGGVGILLPQTNTSTASFAGNYAFGGQDFNVLSTTGEFDFVGLGTVTGTAPNLSFSGTGLISDPFTTLGALPTNLGVPFSGTAVPDTNNPGRYTMSPLQLTVGSNPALGVTIYQASGGQLLWLNDDASSVFLGSLETEGTLTGLPAARRARSNAAAKPKQ